MSVLQAFKSARFVTTPDGGHKQVVLGYDAWQTLISMLEDISDARIAATALQPHQRAIDDSRTVKWEDARAAWLQ